MITLSVYRHHIFFGSIVCGQPDVAQLSDMFFEAAETERALPPAIRKQKLGSWPEYAQQWSAYGYSEFKPKHPRPSPKQVDAYTKALYLGIEHMDADDRKMVWAVSHSAALPGKRRAMAEACKNEWTT